jgi:ADP-ribosylglycohydrolase
MACITGGIAQAYYKKIPDKIAEAFRSKLPPDLREILDKFNTQFLNEKLPNPSYK